MEVSVPVRLFHETVTIVLYGSLEHLYGYIRSGWLRGLDFKAGELDVHLECVVPFVDVRVKEFEQVVAVQIAPPGEWFLECKLKIHSANLNL